MNGRRFSIVLIMGLVLVNMGCCVVFDFCLQQKPVSASNYPIEFYSGEQFIWMIDEAPNSTVEWWNSTSWAFVGKWHATTGDNIEFTIEGNTQINNKSYLVGQFNIGNLTITTNDHDIGTNLVLSVYPWIGGLIYSPQEWSALTTLSPFNEEVGAEISEEQISVLDKKIDAVKIAYNDSFQQTELYYEKITGILIRAETIAGQYSLSMHLQSSSIPLPSVTSGLGIKRTDILLFIMVLGSLITLRIIGRKKSVQSI